MKNAMTHKKIDEGPWRNITDETIVWISRYSESTWRPFVVVVGEGEGKERKRLKKTGGRRSIYAAMRRRVGCLQPFFDVDDWGIDNAVQYYAKDGCSGTPYW